MVTSPSQPTIPSQNQNASLSDNFDFVLYTCLFCLHCFASCSNFTGS